MNYFKQMTIKVPASNTATALQVTGGSIKVGAGTPGTTPGQNDVYVTGTLEVDGKAQLDASTIGLRGVTYTLPAADGSASTYLQTNGSGTLSWAAGTSGSMDDAYNSGSTVTVDSGAVQLNGSHATNNTFFVNKTAGSGHGIQVTNAGTGKDINGTGNTWSVDKAGLGTFVGVTSTGVVTLTGAVLAGASPLIFEGATADDYETTLAVTDPTADRTVTLPDASGTVVLAGTASHDYGAAHADWTLSAAEQGVTYISVTNADAGVNALLSAAVPGRCWFIKNGSGQVLTFKVTGQTGGTIANNKRAFYCSDNVDVYEIWEQS
jgi:hypothetical protein